MPDTPKSSLVSARKRSEDRAEVEAADGGPGPSKAVDWLPRQRNEKKGGDGSASVATDRKSVV